MLDGLYPVWKAIRLMLLMGLLRILLIRRPCLDSIRATVQIGVPVAELEGGIFPMFGFIDMDVTLRVQLFYHAVDRKCKLERCLALSNVGSGERAPKQC